MSVDYIKNPEKTESGQWVTAYACDPLIADDEFLFSKNQYAAITGRDQGARDVLAYHLRISFAPGETDAETANRIGYELAMKLTKGNHALICCTHTDKDHIHTHVVFNSTSLDCTKKFRNFKGSAFAIRRIADHLCVENGLSIIADPKPSRGSYGKWQGDKKPPTNREILERMIDAALENAKDFDGFIAAMIDQGCDVKRGKNLAFKIPGADRFARCKSLGEDYTESAILERLAGARIVAPRKKSGDDSGRKTAEYAEAMQKQNRPNLLIDIQAKIAGGAGEGYTQWMKIFNLKQTARTLIFLKENSIDSYDDLCKRSSAASCEFHERNNRIKDIESRQKEINELQKYIGDYGKTREVYKRYIASGRSRDFYDIHAAEIILHEAAKKHFDSIGAKKLPSINMLRQEWATLEAERKKLYAGFKKIRERYTALGTARANADHILGIGKNEPGRDADRGQKRGDRDTL
jgi:hypothetical protein